MIDPNDFNVEWSNSKRTNDWKLTFDLCTSRPRIRTSDVSHRGSGWDFSFEIIAWKWWPSDHDWDDSLELLEARASISTVQSSLCQRVFTRWRLSLLQFVAFPYLGEIEAVVAGGNGVDAGTFDGDRECDLW